MTWKEAVASIPVPESPSDNWGYANAEPVQSALEIAELSVEAKRLHKRWISSWTCTDTRVGLAVYFLDRTPVAVSAQSGRKSTEWVKFLSLEAALSVREYLLSLVPSTDSSIPLANMDAEIDPIWFEQDGANKI